MAGHIDVRAQVFAPLDVLREIANPTGTPQATVSQAEPPAHGHESGQWNPDRGSFTFSVNPGPASDRTWAYQAERIVNGAENTAYARRWGNENFRYSYAFWQYTGSGDHSEIRCVADFELVPGAPMDDPQMEAFMSRGTQAAMEKTARAVEAEAIRRATARNPGQA